MDVPFNIQEVPLRQRKSTIDEVSVRCELIEGWWSIANLGGRHAGHAYNSQKAGYLKTITKPWFYFIRTFFVVPTGRAVGRESRHNTGRAHGFYQALFWWLVSSQLLCGMWFCGACCWWNLIQAFFPPSVNKCVCFIDIGGHGFGL
jgi:hypothetical protein